MGQGIISRSNPGNSGDKVGDIRITTRNTLGEKWALCNGESIPEGSDYFAKFGTGDPLNSAYWGTAKAYSGPTQIEILTQFSAGSCKEYCIYYHNGVYYYIYITGDDDIYTSTNSSRYLTIYMHNAFSNITAKLVEHQLLDNSPYDGGDETYNFIEPVVDNNFLYIPYQCCLGNCLILYIFKILSDGSLSYHEKRIINSNNSIFYDYTIDKVFIIEGHIYYFYSNYNTYGILDESESSITISEIDDEIVYGCRINCYVYRYNNTAYCLYYEHINSNCNITVIPFIDGVQDIDNMMQFTLSLDINGAECYFIRGSDNEIYLIANNTDNLSIHIYCIYLDTIELEELYRITHEYVSDQMTSNAVSEYWDNFYLSSYILYNKHLYGYNATEGYSFAIDLTTGFVVSHENNNAISDYTSMYCKDFLYTTGYLPAIADNSEEWACFCGDAPSLPTISVDDESYCFIKIKD